MPRHARLCPILPEADLGSWRGAVNLEMTYNETFNGFVASSGWQISRSLSLIIYLSIYLDLSIYLSIYLSLYLSLTILNPTCLQRGSSLSSLFW